MSQHAPEPWSVRVSRPEAEHSTVTVEDRTKRTLFQCMEYLDRIDFTAFCNAQRIVACVNACGDISTEVLESMPFTDAVAEEAIRHGLVLKQRDELLAALIEVRKDVRMLKEGRYVDLRIVERELNAVINK